MAQNEKNLLDRAVSGDDAALSEMLVISDAALRTRFSGKIGWKHRAVLSVGDVLQVTYMEAFLRIGRFQPNGNGAFLSWLTRMAESNLRTAIRDLNRKKRSPRAGQVSLTGDGDSHVALLATLTGSQSSPSQHASRKEIKKAIEQAISLLPADYGVVVHGFDIQGKSAQQIAQEMGRSPGAVYMIKARAHVRLAEILGDSTDFFSRGA